MTTTVETGDGAADVAAPAASRATDATARAPGGTASEEVRLARAYLLHVAEPTAPALADLIDLVGPVDAAARVADGNVPQAVAQETQARSRHRVQDEFERAIARGDRLIVPEDDEWPQWALLAFDQALRRGVNGLSRPLALWARGEARLDEATRRAVTIVGARASTRYGEYIASDWAYELVGAGVTVFSGAAYGIDGAAHRGALAAGGVTVAALGCGLDVGYPAGHDRLLREIRRSGLVISEYPPGTRAAKHRFLVRNRLLAALSAGTVVIEAGHRSGARNTANVADQLGRVVMALPGPVTSVASAGTHAMIRSGQATLVSSAQQVLEAIGTIGEDLEPTVSGESRHLDKLSPHALRVHEALQPRKGKPTEQVAAESGIPIDKVRAVLPMLEIEGLADRCDAGWRLAARTTARGHSSTKDGGHGAGGP